MKKKRVFWIDDDRKFMRQGDWKRPVTDPSFFLDAKLEWMTKHGIRHEVILNLSQLYCNGMERSLARDVIRFQNDFNARIQAENPGKFTCGFVVQPAYIDDALEEIDRCVNELELNLLCLPTHYLATDGKWKASSVEATKPIWEQANRYGLAVEIHPYDGQKIINLEDQYWRFHLIWMCAQTADAYHTFSLLDFPNLYSNTRVCFAHGNQFGQVNYGRRKQGFEGRPDLFEGTVHPGTNIRSPNVFFDSLLHDVYSFRLLIDRQGTSQIIAGIDDPYPLGEMDSVENCYPGKLIDEALEMGFITQEDAQDIWFDNVVNWLYGHRKEAFLERIGVRGKDNDD